MKELTLRRDDVVFREGEIQHTMYQVQAGVVGIFVNDGDADQAQLTELREGSFFGEMALLEGCPRSASAIVLSDTAVLLEISNQELSQYFMEDPQRISAIMRHLSGRLRALTEEYRDVCGTVAEMNQNRTGGTSFEGLAAKIRQFIRVFSSSRNAAEEPVRNAQPAAVDPPRSVRSLLLHSGDVLFREGDESTCMYDLVSGKIGIYKDYGTPAEKKLEEVEPDAFLGELGLIDHAPRSATAVVLRDNTRVLLLYGDNLQQMLTESPGKALELLQKISARLRRLTRDYMEMCRLVATLDQAEKEHTPLSQEDQALALRAEEIWRLMLMDNAANYLMLGMGV